MHFYPKKLVFLVAQKFIQQIPIKNLSTHVFFNQKMYNQLRDNIYLYLHLYSKKLPATLKFNINDFSDQLQPTEKQQGEAQESQQQSRITTAQKQQESEDRKECKTGSKFQFFAIFLKTQVQNR
jgi:hypothetical protein